MEVLTTMKETFVRRSMKKIIAVGTGAMMAGATMTGALAADLGDFPAPFVTDGTYDDANAFVVGDDADAADTLGVLDLGTRLQFDSKVAVEEESTSVTVTGGKTEQIPPGLGLSNSTLFDTTLQDDDIANLWDGEITFQSTSYDTSEELSIADVTDPSVQTSLSSADDDYKTSHYLEVRNRDVIKFFYKFDESINLTKTTASDALEIDFLGDRLKITSVPTEANKFTAYVGEEYYLSAGESTEVTVDGVAKTITLVDVSSTSAVVDVDGDRKIISDGSTSTLNGVEITVDDVFSRTEREESSANLIIGEQSSETYVDGDPYIGEDTDDPDWVWNLEGLATQGTTMNISIENDFVYNDISGGALAEGSCVDLPNEYVSICFDSLTVAETDYATYVFEFTTSADFSDTLSTNTSVPAIYIHTTASEGLDLRAYTASSSLAPNVTSNVKAKEAWIYLPSGTGGMPNGSNVTGGLEAKWIGVFYKDTSNNRVRLFGQIVANGSNAEVLRLNYGNTKDTNVVLRVAGYLGTTSSGLNLTFDVIGDQTADIRNAYDDIATVWDIAATNGSLDSLGATRSTEEATELQWSDTRLNIGTKDEDHRSIYGIIIKNPKGKGASDEVELSIPQDMVKANVVIKGSSSTVAAGGVTYIPAQITPVSKLASEVTDATDYNLILVGGPCANTLVEDLFALTCDGWAYESGEAVVKLVDNGDRVALLVAGTDADDTRRAAKALASYDEYTFSGSEAMVSGTSLTDINVEAVAEAEATA